MAHLSFVATFTTSSNRSVVPLATVPLRSVARGKVARAVVVRGRSSAWLCARAQNLGEGAAESGGPLDSSAGAPDDADSPAARPRARVSDL